MKILRHMAITAVALAVSCGVDRAPQQPQEEIIVENGITYRGTREGFSLSSRNASGFGFTYSNENQSCTYENSTNPAQKHIYTDNGCDASIDTTLFVDCSDPDTCTFLDINEGVRRRDLALIPTVREQLRVNHYMDVWRQSIIPKIEPHR